MPRTTIDEVAKAAGVSKATVSRVLSGNHKHLRASTRLRVEKAIQALNFRPSSVARSLTSKRTHTVGVLVADISNPFYPDVFHGIEDSALKQGYSVFLCNTNYDLARGKHYIQSLGGTDARTELEYDCRRFPKRHPGCGGASGSVGASSLRSCGGPSPSSNQQRPPHCFSPGRRRAGDRPGDRAGDRRQSADRRWTAGHAQTALSARAADRTLCRQ